MMDHYAEFQHVLQEFSPMMDAYWPYVVAIVLGILTIIRSYMGGPECPSDDRIDGKTVIVTGASGGIGRETALELARRGGHVILAVKDEQAGNKVAEEIRKFKNGKADVKLLDLSSLNSVRSFAENFEFDEVDVLINNAGIAFHPYEKTEEGFEMHFVTNYLGHFLLTNLLMPKLKAARQGRVINVSAQAHIACKIQIEDLNLENNNFSALEAYGQSKLAMILMARYMGGILKDTNVTINAVNPGRVRGTQHMRRSPISSTYIIRLLLQPWIWLLLKSPVQGSQTLIYAAVASQLEKCTQGYISDCELKTPSENALDDDLAELLYSKSLLLVEPFMKLPKIESEVE